MNEADMPLGHSFTITFTTDEPLNADQIAEILADFDGLALDIQYSYGEPNINSYCITDEVYD